MAAVFTRAAGSFADQAEFSMPAPSGNGDMYRGVKGTFTFTGTYVTGGETIPKASVGLDEIREILVDPSTPTDAQNGLSFKLAGTPSVPLLKAYKSDATGAGAGSEVANGINITNKAVNVLLLGH